MPVITLTEKAWDSIADKRGQWADEINAVKEGKIVFVPLGERRADTLRITLYEAAKRAGIAVSVRTYVHEGTNGFAVRVKAPEVV